MILMNKRALIATLCCALTLPLIGGCSNAANPNTDNKTHIVTGFYPLQYLAAKIGGDTVDVISLTPPGSDAHNLELSPKAVETLRQADLVIYLSGFQTALDEAIAQAKPKNVLDISKYVQLRTPTELQAEHGSTTTQPTPANMPTDTPTYIDTDITTNASAQSENPASSEPTHALAPAEDEHAGHHHNAGDLDPHFWLDPARMNTAAAAISEQMGKVTPEQQGLYATNLRGLQHALADLDTTAQVGFDNCAIKTTVVTHEAFGYLLGKVGLKQVGLSGLDPEATPTPARLAEIKKIVAAAKVTTIFTEAAISPKAAEAIAEETGAQTRVIDTLATQLNPDQDYLQVMTENLIALREAQQCR